MFKWIGFVVLLATAFFFCWRAEGQCQPVEVPTPPKWKTFPHSITPSAESPMEDTSALQPSLLIVQTVPPCSQVPPTVLDPMPGTGSKLPIIGGKPEVTLKIDPDTLKKLKELIDGIPRQGKADITHQLDPSTLPSLSQLPLAVQVLLLLASVMLGGSTVERVIRWVAPLVNGLLSLRRGPSPEAPPIIAVKSSTRRKRSSAGKAAGPASTAKPASSSA